MSSKSFIKIFNNIARHKHRYTVFSDFVTLSAIALHNAVNKLDYLEAEYMEIIGKYSKDEANSFAELLGELINLLEKEPSDILGSLYMELNLGNAQAGQFFTPSHVSELMAQITYGEDLKSLKKPFITLSDPAGGAGGMILAFVKVMLSNGHNPAYRLWVQCIDIDRIASFMCYIQLSLWNIPAEIIVGNTLSMKFQEHFFTPAHYMYGWTEKLALESMMALASSELKTDLSLDEIQDGGGERIIEPRFNSDLGQLTLFWVCYKLPL